MMPKRFAITLMPMLLLATPALAEEERGEPVSDTSSESSSSCDLKGKQGWSPAAQKKVESTPETHLQRCPEISQYASMALAAKKAAKPPQPCAAFAQLPQERLQVARYNWAYGTAMEVLKEKGKTERVQRIGKGLALYKQQFAEYDAKISEFGALCFRVHSPSVEASAKDVAMWAQSGSIMKKAVESRRSAVWNRGNIKSSLDSSFGSIAKLLK